jgi:uncharacterized protein
METGQLDLEGLALRSGQATAVEFRLDPDPPVIGAEPYPIEGRWVDARVEVSRTTSGYALRLLAELTVTGPCVRCLEPTELSLRIESREVDQPRTDDGELRSPYVAAGILDATAWLHDAIMLALPETILCRPDCLGLCEVCGADLNELEPGSHTHEKPLDPRFAKLRELSGD